jgi:hypothetical protein
MILRMLKRTILLLFMATTGAYTADGVPPKGSPAKALVDGCKLLDSPAHFTKKMVSVEGTLTVGFERFDLTFNCPGKVDLAFALWEPDKAKYGFLSDANANKELDDHLKALDPSDVLTTRGNKSVHVVVTGLFRCHYDFPDCKDLSRDGDSSIIIKSLQFIQP